ncbi:MAG: Rrf2 family transcriptional regulator [Deltaproteobacteria bacterium]|nr:Rrf2 family transcriptional regulator [Deltaproteobacteria bacterium]
MKLSTRSRYAVRLLLDLARHQGHGPVQIGDISRRQEISVKYLEQLIRPLKKAKLVSSVRGPKGGHLLSAAPEEITLGQVVRLLEGQSELVVCDPDPDICDRSDDCQVRLVWQTASRAMYEKLDAVSIADLLVGIGEAGSEPACPAGEPVPSGRAKQAGAGSSSPRRHKGRKDGKRRPTR